MFPRLNLKPSPYVVMHLARAWDCIEPDWRVKHPEHTSHERNLLIDGCASSNWSVFYWHHDIPDVPGPIFLTRIRDRPCKAHDEHQNC